MAFKHTINTSYIIVITVLVLIITAVIAFFTYPLYMNYNTLRAHITTLQEEITTTNSDIETLSAMPAKQDIDITNLPINIKKSDISAYFEVYGLCIEKLESLMDSEYLTFDRITFVDIDTKTASPLHIQPLILEGTASQNMYYELLENIINNTYPAYFERTPYINELSKTDIEYLKTHPLPASRVINSEYNRDRSRHSC